MSDAASRLISADPWASTLGVEVVTAGPGHATLTMDLVDDHMNFLDGAHGGALFTIVEAAVRAASAVDGTDARVMDVHLSLTAGAQTGDRFTARAEKVAGSRALATYRVVVERDDGRVVGVATGVARAPT